MYDRIDIEKYIYWMRFSNQCPLSMAISQSPLLATAAPSRHGIVITRHQLHRATRLSTRHSSAIRLWRCRLVPRRRVLPVWPGFCPGSWLPPSCWPAAGEQFREKATPSQRPTMPTLQPTLLALPWMCSRPVGTKEWKCKTIKSANNANTSSYTSGANKPSNEVDTGFFFLLLLI